LARKGGCALEKTLPATATGENVGFLLRTLAFVADTLLVGVVTGLLSGPLFGGETGRGGALGALLTLAYYVYFWSSAGGGQTLGMKILGLRVVTAGGAPLTVTGAVIRYVGLLIAFAALLVGVIWIAFDERKQGWHDKIAGTYVVKA
jgi:uncharacterized RDD family membrane protein YckC